MKLLFCDNPIAKSFIKLANKIHYETFRNDIFYYFYKLQDNSFCLSFLPPIPKKIITQSGDITVIPRMNPIIKFNIVISSLWVEDKKDPLPVYCFSSRMKQFPCPRTLSFCIRIALCGECSVEWCPTIFKFYMKVSQGLTGHPYCLCFSNKIPLFD